LPPPCHSATKNTTSLCVRPILLINFTVENSTSLIPVPVSLSFSYGPGPQLGVPALCYSIQEVTGRVYPLHHLIVTYLLFLFDWAVKWCR
jgi:hypothetical protein